MEKNSFKGFLAESAKEIVIHSEKRDEDYLFRFKKKGAKDVLNFFVQRTDSKDESSFLDFKETKLEDAIKEINNLYFLNKELADEMIDKFKKSKNLLFHVNGSFAGISVYSLSDIEDKFGSKFKNELLKFIDKI